MDKHLEEDHDKTELAAEPVLQSGAAGAPVHPQARPQGRLRAPRDPVGPVEGDDLPRFCHQEAGGGGAGQSRAGGTDCSGLPRPK